MVGHFVALVYCGVRPTSMTGGGPSCTGSAEEELSSPVALLVLLAFAGGRGAARTQEVKERRRRRRRGEEKESDVAMLEEKGRERPQDETGQKRLWVRCIRERYTYLPLLRTCAWGSVRSAAHHKLTCTTRRSACNRALVCCRPSSTSVFF